MQAKHKRILIWSLLGIAVVVLLMMALRPPPVPVDMAIIEHGPLTISIVEEGKTRIHDVFALSAPVAGRLKRIQPEVGDRVVAGETIIAELEPLDSAFLDPRSETQARANIRTAEAAESLARSNIDQALAEFEYAQSEHQRAHQLVEDGIISRQDMDAIERRYKTAKAAYASALASLDMRTYELQQAKAQLLSPAHSEAFRIDCECLRLSAPVDGRILRIFDASERVVSPGERLLEIGDPGKLEVVVDLLSVDAVQAAPGQTVLLKNWGGKQSLQGVVRQVEPFAYTKISALGIEEQRVNVIVDILSPAEHWRTLGHGYQIEAHILLQQLEQVLRIPLTALFREQGQWSVFVVSNGQARQRPIELGARNALHAELVNGLQTGDQVIVHPSDRIMDGTRVVSR